MTCKMAGGAPTQSTTTIGCPSSLWRKSRIPKTTPQGLKPISFWAICGTAEAVPFQNLTFTTGC